MDKELDRFFSARPLVDERVQSIELAQSLSPRHEGSPRQP